MRDDQIVIKPFEFLEVLQFSMMKKENEHTAASFAVRITEALEDSYVEMAIDGLEAEISVLQSLEPEDTLEILNEVKKDDGAAALNMLRQVSSIRSTAKGIKDEGIEGALTGVNMLLKEQQDGNIKREGAAQSAGGTTTAMDVMSVLPAAAMMKSKGIQKTYEVLSALQSTGVINALKGKSAEEVAKTPQASDAIRKEVTLLKGVVTELAVTTENGVKVLSGTVKSGTFLMDVTPHVRTWQDAGITYEDMIDTFIGDYKDGHFIMTARNKAIKTFVLQYRETDWEFAKRIASHDNEFLVADDLTGGTKFYYGMPGRTEEAIEIVTTSYSMQKRLIEYLNKKDNQVPDIQEKDAIYYRVELRDIYNVGDPVNLNGQQLYISRIDSRLRGSELYHTYQLKTKEGFKLPRAFNQKVIGVSLASAIISVSKDVVEVSVDLDENQDGCGTRWFPYSTVYSTPDGTGWYCMPEPGDAMRLYLPHDDEREGYVISAVHLGTDNGEERTTPDNKSIMNKYGKEILMTPDTLVFTNNAGMSVSIIDGEGIEMVSDKKISISSKESVTIRSDAADVVVNGSSSVNFVQGGTKISLKDSIEIEGTQTNIQ